MSGDHQQAAEGPGAPRFMHHVKSAPPVDLLKRYVERLERGGLTVALGGSGLLAALGLGDIVHDWDLTTDDPYDRVFAALAGERFVVHGSDSLHADRKLRLAGGTVEVIVGFAFHAGGSVVRIETRVSARVDGIPLGSPEGWAAAYHLLGRADPCEALLRHLARHGASRARLAPLLAEPLPPSLAARLARLPTSSNP